jgi:hypothetical protein
VPDFFYSPTTFNLRKKQFVYDSVLDFFKSSTDRECQAPPANDQQRANEDTMGLCASVHIEPLLVIVEQLHEGKRIVLRVSDYTVGIDAVPGLMIILLLFLQKQSLVIRLFQLLIDIVRHVLSRDDKQRADSFIETLHKMIGCLKNGLGECVTKDMKCFLEPVFGDYDSDVSTLPMPTPCWTTYLTFFGDNQQLSCTKADTCKQGRLQSLSDLVVCGACPVLSA